MADKNALDWIVYILVIVGGLNWGLVAIGNWAGTNLNLVNLIFGALPALENIIYLLVGLSALYLIYLMTKK